MFSGPQRAETAFRGLLDSPHRYRIDLSIKSLADIEANLSRPVGALRVDSPGYRHYTAEQPASPAGDTE